MLVAADVVPVTLDLSDEELLFSFSLDNWDDHVQQVRACEGLLLATTHMCTMPDKTHTEAPLAAHLNHTASWCIAGADAGQPSQLPCGL